MKHTISLYSHKMEDPKLNFKQFFTTKVISDSFRCVLFFAPDEASYDTTSFSEPEEAVKYAKVLSKLHELPYISEDSGFVTVATLGIGTNSFLATYVRLRSRLTVIEPGIVGDLKSATEAASKYAQDHDLLFMDYFGLKV
jgi:hypothetical protein